MKLGTYVMAGLQETISVPLLNDADGAGAMQVNVVLVMKSVQHGQRPDVELFEFGRPAEARDEPCGVPCGPRAQLPGAFQQMHSDALRRKLAAGWAQESMRQCPKPKKIQKGSSVAEERLRVPSYSRNGPTVPKFYRNEKPCQASQCPKRTARALART